MKIIITVLSLLLLGNIASATQDHRLEVYGVAGTDMSAMLELIDTILDGEGRSIPDPRGGRVFVNTTPEKHNVLRKAFSQVSATARNIQLTVRFVEQQQKQEDAAAVEGQVTRDRSGTRWRIRPSARHQTETASQDIQQMLVARSGHEARLRIGEQLPYLEWTADYSPFHSRIQVGTRWQEVGAFLVFQPILLPDGETILIRLTPEIRGIAPDASPQTFRFRTIETELIVRNGQTTQIGGWSEANTLYNRFLIGRSRQTQSTDLKIQITPQILP